MRTIIVIFTERKLSLNEIASYKRYKFLCNYDTVSLYDMVEDPRYTGKMMVVGCNTGYFLGNYNTNNGPVVDCCNGVGVYQHNTVQYAGVVYFKNQEDAIKAVKILGKRVKSLFD